MDSIGRLEAVNSINIMDREYRKANFLKQEVKNHVKIVALTVVDLIKESTPISYSHLNFSDWTRPYCLLDLISCHAEFGEYVLLRVDSQIDFATGNVFSFTFGEWGFYTRTFSNFGNNRFFQAEKLLEKPCQQGRIL